VLRQLPVHQRVHFKVGPQVVVSFYHHTSSSTTIFLPMLLSGSCILQWMSSCEPLATDSDYGTGTHPYNEFRRWLKTFLFDHDAEWTVLTRNIRTYYNRTVYCFKYRITTVTHDDVSIYAYVYECLARRMETRKGEHGSLSWWGGEWAVFYVPANTV